MNGLTIAISSVALYSEAALPRLPVSPATLSADSMVTRRRWNTSSSILNSRSPAFDLADVNCLISALIGPDTNGRQSAPAGIASVRKWFGGEPREYRENT